jgi:hypothetical protein
VQLSGVSDAVSDPQRTEFYRAFIGKRWTDYYLKRFALFDERGGSFYLSWNWAAFLFFFLFSFAPLWALHRGMYAVFFLCLLGMSLIQSATVTVLLPHIGGIAFAVIFPFSWVCFGLYANALYYKYVQRKIRNVLTKSKGHAEAVSYLASEGGTDTWGCVIIVVVLALPGFLFVQARHDYTVRSRISEATRMATPARVAVETVFKRGYSLDRLRSHASLGLGRPTSYSSKYVQSVTVGTKGMVTVTLADEPRLAGARNGTVSYVPIGQGNRLEWDVMCSFAARLCPRK